MFFTFYLNSSGQSDKPTLKGHINIGGDISFKLEKLKDINPTVTYSQNIKTFESNLILGYFIIDQLSTGLKVDYLIERDDLDILTIPNRLILQDLLIGPVVRYYTKPAIFGEVNYSIGILNSGPPENQIKWRNYSWSIGVGYCFILNQYLTVEPLVKYRQLHKNAYKIEEGQQINEGLIFSLGFQIYLNSKKNIN
jgi:hypothetical protein